jgi:hypothetical protein
MARRHSITQFELGVKAVVAGDEAILGALVLANRALLRARSTRAHRATLLHYAAARGGEACAGAAQRNAVNVTEMLRRAGAVVDGVAEIYRGEVTALGLLRSCKALLRQQLTPAGVQAALIETLLDAGADIHAFAGGWQPLMWALAAGRQEAAETLLRRGARVDNLGTAVLLGRLDLVEKFVCLDTEPRTQIEYAFLLACGGSRTDIATFLLNMGVDLAAKDDIGHTALHCAAWSGNTDIVQLLLERGASLEAKNSYGGTVLGSTLWFALNDPFDGVDYPTMINLLIAAGAKVDVTPNLEEDVSEVLRRYTVT